MELKWNGRRLRLVGARSNRTFMELKLISNKFNT